MNEDLPNAPEEQLAADSAEDATPAEPVLVLENGTETGMAKFCEQSFVDPESARVGSKALISAFDDNGLWLASLVQPAHLIAELRQSCNTLTTLIITQWTRQGETQKLTRLGEAMLDASPPLETHEAGQMMALLASLLGILRPQRAQRLLEASRPLLRDSADPRLLKEAIEWVATGRILEKLHPEDRIFWNRRLREPSEEWEWDSAEARSALRKVAPLMPADDTDLSHFQRTVPGCWWDLLREPVATAPVKAAAVASPAPTSRTGPSFATGLLTGLAATAVVAAGIWHFGGVGGTKPLVKIVHEGPSRDSQLESPEPAPARAETPAPKPTPAAAAAQPPAAAAVAEVKTGAEPASAPPEDATKVQDSLRRLQALLGPALPKDNGKAPADASTPAAPGAEAEVRPAILPTAGVAATQTEEVTLEVLAASAGASKPAARQLFLERFVREHADMQRFYNIAKNGSPRESEALIQGRSSIAALGSPMHQNLLRWLLLDPPDNPAVRETVSKLAVRLLPPDEMILMLELCQYPGSPNPADARQCADWLLALNESNLSVAHKQKLKWLSVANSQ